MAMPSDLYRALQARGGLREDAAQRAVLPLLDRIAAAAGERPPGRLRGWLGRQKAAGAPGLYLWGAPGRGKSLLAGLAVEALPGRARRVHFHAFMREVHAGLDTTRRAGQRDPLAHVAAGMVGTARLLCLDEVEITDIADAMIVGRLFQALLDLGVIVLATSNLPPEGLYEGGLNRDLFVPFIALIGQRLQVVALNGPDDWRRIGEHGAGAWLAPADAVAEAAMESIWTGLAGGGAAAPLLLEVGGRHLALGRARGRVARIDFADLCEAPLGAADYLALAGTLDTLLIDRIPCFGAADGAAARRFIVLVDVIYEARLRLIATAAAPPDALCRVPGEELAFRRTASRLVELTAARQGSPATATGEDDAR